MNDDTIQLTLKDSAMPRATKRRRKDVNINDNNKGTDSNEDEEELDHAHDHLQIYNPLEPLNNAQPYKWQQTIEHSIKAIVSIRFSQVSAFDTEGAETSEASGFIVDAERGILLTNRHVACAGPFLGEMVAHDHEEVDVYPIYRDPVHDFGFLKFDPSKIHHMKVIAIPLAPHLARVGLDVRVVGNDAGEKLSILAGSISRLDRNAPEYGDLTYNDFNTHYLQAASSTSGGSSGSPVIDIDGNCVALQAGGHTKAATDFFLPLDRIARALRLLQNGLDVPRGTIQLQWLFRPFDEARRLGLQQDTEALVRSLSRDEIGMLVAEAVVPEGPSASLIEEGDVLVKVNGELITKFVTLENLLDESVGKEVTVDVERGGSPLTFKVKVQDLHAITPDRYVEAGGAVLNEVSYLLARLYSVPVGGVYVASPTGMFKLGGPDNGWIISSIDNKPTPNLDSFVEVFKSLPDGSRVPVVFYSIADIHTTSVAVVQVDRHWSGFRMAIRNDKTGLWDFTDLGKPSAPLQISPATAKFGELDDNLGVANDLIKSLVKVSFYTPIKLDGYPRHRKAGAGLVVDATAGIIVVSRAIVPTSLGDVSLTFADSIIIPGKVEYLHPTHNFAFLRYDPKLIGETPVKSAPFSDVPLVQGHSVSLVVYNHNMAPFCLNTVVTDIATCNIPINSTPRFRGINCEAVTVDAPLAQLCSSGVLADTQGKVQGLWLSYLCERKQSGQDSECHLGLRIGAIYPVLRSLQCNPPQSPKLRNLNVEFCPIAIHQARHMGLSETWVRKVENANPYKHQLFTVRRVEGSVDANNVLKELDIVLSVDGKTITRMCELDVQYEKETLKMTILRQNKEMTIDVPTYPIDGNGTSRVVVWAGAVLQAPHKAVLQQSKTLPSQIYVTSQAMGSPACMYQLTPTMWITHVNGVSTPDLDAFLAAVRKVPDNSYVRVGAISFDNAKMVISVKTNSHYWPTTDLVKDPSEPSGWKKIVTSLED